ncbi:hypothetical protein ACFLQN_04900, partial [Candidatus Aenigmatarchaeota archaeon]
MNLVKLIALFSTFLIISLPITFAQESPYDFQVSQPYSVSANCDDSHGDEHTNKKFEELSLVETGRSICFLSGAGFEDVDDENEYIYCSVGKTANQLRWEIEAMCQGDADSYCGARCVAWPETIADYITVEDFRVESFDDGPKHRTMTPIENSVCFLSYVRVHDVDSDKDEDILCDIKESGQRWVLEANSEDGTDGGIECRANCLVWDPVIENLGASLIVSEDIGTSTTQSDSLDVEELVWAGQSICSLDKVYYYSIDLEGELGMCSTPIDSDGYWKSVALEVSGDDDAWKDGAKIGGGAVGILGASLGIVVGAVVFGTLFGVKAGIVVGLKLGLVGGLVGVVAGAIVGGLIGWATGWFTGDWDSKVWCESRCLEWNFENLTNICGNSIVEPPYEQCDDGDLNGPDGNCSLSCKWNYCAPEVLFDMCEENTGMFCMNAGNDTFTDPILAPNCRGQRGSSACGCQADEVCDMGLLDIDDYNGEYYSLYNEYFPFQSGFEDGDVKPTLKEDDGATGSGFITANVKKTGSNSYEIIKGLDDDGTIRVNFTFNVTPGEDYITDAWILTEKDESIIMYGNDGRSRMGESRYGKQGNEWYHLTYPFTPRTNKHDTIIEVNKRGTYYIDDVTVRKEDYVCMPRCQITSAGFETMNNADYGDEAIVTVNFVGNCPDEFYVQLDAISDDSTCTIEHSYPFSDGWIRGIDIFCDQENIQLSGTSGECIAKWKLDQYIPEDCAGKTAEATYASIWEEYILGTWVTQKSLTDLDGKVRFVNNPIPETCLDYDYDEDIEQCDPTATGWEITCSEADETYIDGNITCTDRCEYDYDQCLEPVCGNGIKDGEVCDYGIPPEGHDPLGGETCQSLNYDSGNLRCEDEGDQACQAF